MADLAYHSEIMGTKLLITLIALANCVLFAQNSPPASPDKLQSQLSPLSGWLGDWHCDGKFIKSGTAISSTVRFSSALQGRWIEMQQDDLPPNRFHAVEFWGYDDAAGKFTATVFDNFSPTARVFAAAPLRNGTLTWDREASGGGPTTGEQFIFENADSKLKITYQVMRGGSWVVGDVLTCTRR